jgi:hypothetical protein
LAPHPQALDRAVSRTLLSSMGPTLPDAGAKEKLWVNQAGPGNCIAADGFKKS